MKPFALFLLLGLCAQHVNAETRPDPQRTKVDPISSGVSEPQFAGQPVRYWMTPFGFNSPDSHNFYRNTPPFAPYWMLRYQSFTTNGAALLESERVIRSAFRRIKTETWFRRARLWRVIRMEIASALNDPNPNVRWNAVFAIDPLYFEEADALLLLLPVLKDKDAMVKTAAVLKWNQFQKKRGRKTLPLPLNLTGVPYLATQAPFCRT